MDRSVASVTVSYNTADVLPRQMEALFRQTCPLQEIIVVDNASTDGTLRVLADRYPRVTVLRMSSNLGIGGALAAGMSYAMHKGHDWIWTFDSDSVPSDDALEVLLAAAESLMEQGDKVGIVAPIPWHEASGACYPSMMWREGFSRCRSQSAEQPISFPDVVITSGSLVKRRIVEDIGVPRADFFIDSVDSEYCLRARSHGYRIAAVNNAKMHHEIGTPRKLRLPGFVRTVNDQPFWRHYYICRNLTYLVCELYPSRRAKRWLLRELSFHAMVVLLVSSQKLASLRKMAQGVWDGRRSKLGVRFLPG